METRGETPAMHPGIADLLQPESAWSAFANTLPCIVYSLTPLGTLEFVNDRCFELTGYEAAIVYGSPLSRFIHPEDVPRAVAGFTEAIERGDAYDYDVRFLMNDGTYRAMRSSARPSFDPAGVVVRYIGTLIDVEDRIRMLASRNAAERRLDIFLETVPQIVWTADATGWIDWYNKRWFDFTGQTQEEAAGWGWQAAHHPNDFLRVMESWPKSIETGEPFEMEFRLRRYDGIFHWFLTRVVPLRDETGNVIRWYGANTDIEEQKSAQRRSSEIAHTLQAAFLPERLPTRENLRFDAEYVPAESEALVGGDWYDAIDLPDGRIVISCGDVAGHGVNASVSVGRLRQAILFSALECAEPADILGRVNRISSYQDPIVATCVVAVLDPGDRSLRYALAGHPPPIVARSDAAAEFAAYADAPPLGVVDDLRAVTRTLHLELGDAVVFYSDGVTEFDRDIGGAEARLLAAAGRIAREDTVEHPAAELRRAVMGEAPSRDDIALLIVQFSPERAGGSEPSRPQTMLVKKWRFHSSDARTARDSRKELVAFLSGLTDGSDDLYTAELVLGEMLANTVEHAPGLVEITIDWNGVFPTLTAADSGPGMRIPERIGTPDDLSESGRGLFLINVLARSVTIESTPERGTRLCATLPLVKRRA